MPTVPAPSAPRHLAQPRERPPWRSLSFWAAPLLTVLALAVAGTALYMGGLSDPTAHLRDFPVALVNRDAGADAAGGEHRNLGREVVDGFVDGAEGSDELDLRVLDWDAAQQQLDSGRVYAAVVVPETFSADATGLVQGALTSEDSRRPRITVLTDPQAGTLGTRLAAGAVEPALQEASVRLGEQLTAAAEQAEEQASAAIQRRLADAQAEQSRELAAAAAQAGPGAQAFARQVAAAQEGIPGSLAAELAPRVSSASAAALADPVDVVVEAFHEPQPGTALGMGAFYYAVLLLVLGLSGSIGASILIDGRLGVAPLELGPVFRQRLRARPSRRATFLMKWGVVVLAGAPAAGSMMAVCAGLGVPLPHGFLLFLLSWLSIATVSAVTLALVTVLGSAGLVLAMVYLVLMGLPSAGAVVPLEALPEFFRAIAAAEPLHHMATSVRAVLYFDAVPDAGLRVGPPALGALLAGSVALALAVGAVYDRRAGRRGAVR